LQFLFFGNIAGDALGILRQPSLSYAQARKAGNRSTWRCRGHAAVAV